MNVYPDVITGKKRFNAILTEIDATQVLLKELS
jgi:hypothetical protein